MSRSWNMPSKRSTRWESAQRVRVEVVEATLTIGRLGIRAWWVKRYFDIKLVHQHPNDLSSPLHCSIDLSAHSEGIQAKPQRIMSSRHLGPCSGLLVDRSNTSDVDRACHIGGIGDQVGGSTKCESGPVDSETVGKVTCGECACVPALGGDFVTASTGFQGGSM
jgi:hypothetical protein